MLSKLKTLVLTAVLGFFALPAFAEIDVSAATTTISTDGTAAVTAIGGAMLALAGVAIVFKWGKAAIFG